MLAELATNARSMSELSKPAADAQAAVPRQLSDVALIGVYEITKILVAPNRLETTLSNVLNLLSSFMDMRNGTIVLMDDDGEPDIVVGTYWSESSSAPRRDALPQKALDQIVATAMPLVVQNVIGNPLFEGSSIGSAVPDAPTVSFIGVPIRIHSKVVGTLTIDRPWRENNMLRFDHDVRFLAMVANLIGQTVHLQRVVSRDRERLMEESRRLEKRLESNHGSGPKARISGIIGDSPAMRGLMEKITIVAKSNATVLLRGESGTGKELFARAIHEQSPRAKMPFVKVNCAALPESVLESELFGHEKGAFTGAINARKGRFEMADGGTLFLDEIGEISASFQAKLLRVLQEGEFDRVGSSRTFKVNVRIVAATNKNLEEAVAKGEFRADLYYRISVVPLLLPALRDRKGDIPLLARTFLERFNKENQRTLKLTSGAVDVLKACYFPGNVRELENCVCRTATLTQADVIDSVDFACGHGECLSATLWKARGAHPGKSIAGLQPSAGGSQPVRPSIALPIARPQSAEGADSNVACGCGAAKPGDNSCANPTACEHPDIDVRISRERLIEAMERSGWVQAKAARILSLTPRQIGYALKKHNIDIKKF